jgi:hypothetical protein
MRLLTIDLYYGGGGVSMGLFVAGFDVIGCTYNHSPNTHFLSSRCLLWMQISHKQTLFGRHHLAKPTRASFFLHNVSGTAIFGTTWISFPSKIFRTADHKLGAAGGSSELMAGTDCRPYLTQMPGNAGSMPAIFTGSRIIV